MYKLVQTNLYFTRTLIHLYSGNTAIDSDTVLCLSSLSMQGLTFPQILNLGMDSILLFIPMSIAMATKRALQIATKVCTQISTAHGPA